MVPSVFASVILIMWLLPESVDGFYVLSLMPYRKNHCGRQNTAVRCCPEEAESELSWRKRLILRNFPINLQPPDQSAASWKSIGLESHLNEAMENIQQTVTLINKEKSNYGTLPPGPLVAINYRNILVNLLVAG